jgi:hypothetical protein
LIVGCCKRSLPAIKTVCKLNRLHTLRLLNCCESMEYDPIDLKD